MKAVQTNEQKLLTQWQISDWSELDSGRPRRRGPRGKIERGYEATVRRLQIGERHTIRQQLKIDADRLNVGHKEVDEVDIQPGIKPRSEVALLLRFH